MDFNYNITTDIMKKLELLPLSMKLKVKEYIYVLEKNIPQKGNAVNLKNHYGSIDNESAEEMKKAIEEGCEKVDVENW